MTRRTRLVALVAGGVILACGAVLAQRGTNLDAQPNVPYDGRFTFVRISYHARGGMGFGRRGGGLMWNHDYPRAEAHFGKILSEVSLTDTYQAGGNVLALDDPELFKYPIAYIVEPGSWVMNQKEAAGLRDWLAKGGFLIVDDFAGGQWYNFEDQIRLILPDARPIKLDVSHPVFDSFFRIASLEMTHPYYGLPSEFYGIFEDNDPSGRMLVMINYNNDVAEYWEWSDEDFAPIELTNEAYKLGVNYIIYALTH